MADAALLHRVALVGWSAVAVLVLLWLVRRADTTDSDRNDPPLSRRETTTRVPGGGQASGGISERLRKRFIIGLPWGTLTVCVFVLLVYLFGQTGLDHWYNPVVIPFRAWTYFAPLGVAMAAFTHTGPGHLIGNLVGTLVLAPLAEYAWGHFPRRRGASSFGTPLDHPYVRAFVVFPAAVLAVGLFTAAFSIGPIIGFSGVVFAFAGAALVYRPLLTVVALAGADALRLGYTALQNPVTTASGRPAFITPWWADIAIQGHAIGLLAGVTLGALLAARRGTTLPSPGRLFMGAFLFGVAQSLWAVYWFRGGETFVLYRAIGLTLVVTLALLVAGLGVTGRIYSRDGNHEGIDSGLSATPLLRSDGSGGGPADGVTPRQVSLVALVFGAALLSGPAIPVNLTTVSDEPLPGDPMEVRGYEVTYAEDVTNGMVSVVDVSAFGETTRVNTSGVIVRNPDRGVWTTAVTKGRLAFAGQTRIVLGGLGWRQTVLVTRDGWNAVGGGTAYRISLGERDTRRVVFVSEPAQADPVIAGRNVSVTATGEGFQILVERNGSTVTGAVPAANETIRIGGVRFVRQNGAVIAAVNETRVTVLRRETYRGQT